MVGSLSAQRPKKPSGHADPGAQNQPHRPPKTQNGSANAFPLEAEPFFSSLFNHSCSPTAGIKGVSELFALRDIGQGEEITYDYSLTIAPTEWATRCKCGSRDCRKVIGDILSVPRKRREEYRESGALQTYMRRLLKEIDAGRYKIPRYEVQALERLNS